jgi:hypothetical protein
MSTIKPKSMSQQMIEGEIRRQTGKQYQVDWSKLAEPELLEVLRLLRELQTNKDAATRRAREQPWSR